MAESKLIALHSPVFPRYIYLMAARHSHKKCRVITGTEDNIIWHIYNSNLCTFRHLCVDTVIIVRRLRLSPMEKHFVITIIANFTGDQ